MSAPAQAIVFVIGEDAVILATNDDDLALGSTLDETDMSTPPHDGLWLWVDSGSYAEPPGLDSLYSEGVVWVGEWRRLTTLELHNLAVGWVRSWS